MKIYLVSEFAKKSHNKEVLDQLRVKNRMLSFYRTPKSADLAGYVKSSLKGKRKKNPTIGRIRKTRTEAQITAARTKALELKREGVRVLRKIVYPAIEKSIKEVLPDYYDASVKRSTVRAQFPNVRLIITTHASLFFGLDIDKTGSENRIGLNAGISQTRTHSRKYIDPYGTSVPFSEVNAKWVTKKVEEFIKALKAGYKA